MFFFLYSSSLITLGIPGIPGSDLRQWFQWNFFSSSIKCGSQISIFCPDPICKMFFSRSLNLIKRRGLFSCDSHSLNKIGVVNFIRALPSHASCFLGSYRLLLWRYCKQWLRTFHLHLYCGCVWPHSDYVSLQTSYVCVFFKRRCYYVFTKWFRVFHSGSLCCLILRSASVYFHSGSVCS